MEITIKIEGAKAILQTEVRGHKIITGMKRAGCGYWKQCTEKNLEDYDDILDEEEMEALDNIDLADLQGAFGEEWEDDEGEVEGEGEGEGV